MFNTILLLAAFTPVISPNETDSTIAHKVDLDEVTVTEFKQNKHNLTPSSISAVDSRFLHRQEVTSLKELTAIMPNFYMPDYGSKQNAPVYIRGIGAKAKGPTVGFYVDGVPHFENSAFDIDMSDIAEVNVFRGPQGTLYGRNAIGGIISVHTRSPLEYQGTRLKVGYGNRNDVSAQFANYTMMGPKLGFAVAGGYHHNDGFFRNAATGTKADGINSGFGRLTSVWKPGQQWLSVWCLRPNNGKNSRCQLQQKESLPPPYIYNGLQCKIRRSGIQLQQPDRLSVYQRSPGHRSGFHTARSIFRYQRNSPEYGKSGVYVQVQQRQSVSMDIWCIRYDSAHKQHD